MKNHSRITSEKSTDNRPGKSLALLGMLLGLALLCSYVETLIPFHFRIPGIKLGLANIVVVIAMYLIGPKEALLITVARIFLSGLLFGNMFAVVYSLAGGLLSFFVMFLLKTKIKLHVISVSAAGGISHNLGQLIVAALVVENINLLYYMSVLFFAGLLTGLLIGIVSREILARLSAV